MRSLDREQDRSETLLSSFETTLQKRVGNLREEREVISQQDLKTFIRFYCKKNAQTLGLKEEEIDTFVPYFFTCLYENPTAKKEMWKTLHALSQAGNDHVKTETLFDQLLTLNTEGITHLWRIVRSIVRGEYEVKSKSVEEQAIYTIVPAQNASENAKDPKRQALSTALKEKVRDRIVDKPIPNTGEDSLHMTQQDRELFFKIFRYLQSDADALVTSEAWHPVIGKYFTGITKHLLSTIKLLDVKRNKSNKRKQRYKKFIVHALQTYVKPLLAYCKQMAEDQKEANPFATDILFETYLIENNLIDGPKEPSYTVIENKWQLLYKQMKQYIEDEATMFGLPAVSTPEQFGPQVTDELREDDLQTVRERSAKALNATLIMGTQAPPPPQDDAVQKEKDDWADVWEHAISTKEEEPEKSVDAILDDTAAMSALITKEIDRFPDIQETNKKPKRRSALVGNHYIAVVPGSEAEKTLLATIRQDINNLFSRHHHGITCSHACNDFANEFVSLVKNKISTPQLMEHFFTCVLAHYEDLQHQEDKAHSDNVFDNISAGFNHLAQEINLPLPIAKEIGFKKRKDNPSAIPPTQTIEEIQKAVPSIDDPAFATLKSYLQAKSLYEQFKEIETLMRDNMLETDILKLDALKQLNRRLKLAVSPVEGFTYYHYEQQQTIVNAYKQIRKLSGNWFTKHFKFGRSAEVKQEMKNYLTSLTAALETTWNDAMQPLLITYGTIIFGSDLYVQRQ
ncbi:hypothetical protein GF369_00370 [Candidatus Peregrinibacteria bacterium]|nr:hypothetical protein [Candidatus Peregrinibacteria bacterium]